MFVVNPELSAKEHVRLFAQIVDGALLGNEHALDCWEAMRPSMLQMREPTLDELAGFQQAYDRFHVAPTKKGGFTVDLRDIDQMRGSEVKDREGRGFN